MDTQNIGTNIGGETLAALRAGLRGAAYVPGDEGYDGTRVAWNSTPASARRSWSWLRARRTFSRRCA